MSTTRWPLGRVLVATLAALGLFLAYAGIASANSNKSITLTAGPPLTKPTVIVEPKGKVPTKGEIASAVAQAQAAQAESKSSVKIWMLTYIRADGVRPEEVRRLTAQGKCFFVGPGTKYPTYGNSGGINGTGPYKVFPDSRRAYVCRTGKGPTGLQKMYNVEADGTKSHWCWNYIFLYVPKNHITGIIILIRGTGSFTAPAFAKSHSKLVCRDAAGRIIGLAEAWATASGFISGRTRAEAKGNGKIFVNVRASIDAVAKTKVKLKCPGGKIEVPGKPGKTVHGAVSKIVENAAGVNVTGHFVKTNLQVNVFINDQFAFRGFLLMDGKTYGLSADGNTRYAFPLNSRVKGCEVNLPTNMTPKSGDLCITVIASGDFHLPFVNVMNCPAGQGNNWPNCVTTQTVQGSTFVTGVATCPPSPTSDGSVRTARIDSPLFTANSQAELDQMLANWRNQNQASANQAAANQLTTCPKNGTPGAGSGTGGQTGGSGSGGSAGSGAGPTCRDSSGNIVSGNPQADGTCPGSTSTTTGGSTTPVNQPAAGRCIDPVTKQERNGAKDMFGYCT